MRYQDEFASLFRPGFPCSRRGPETVCATRSSAWGCTAWATRERLRCNASATWATVPCSRYQICRKTATRRSAGLWLAFATASTSATARSKVALRLAPTGRKVFPGACARLDAGQLGEGSATLQLDEVVAQRFAHPFGVVLLTRASATPTRCGISQQVARDCEPSDPHPLRESGGSFECAFRWLMHRSMHAPGTPPAGSEVSRKSSVLSCVCWLIVVLWCR